MDLMINLDKRLHRQSCHNTIAYKEPYMDSNSSWLKNFQSFRAHLCCKIEDKRKNHQGNSGKMHTYLQCGCQEISTIFHRKESQLLKGLRPQKEILQEVIFQEQIYLKEISALKLHLINNSEI